MLLTGWWFFALVCVICIWQARAADQGFNLMFTSQPNTFKNLPIIFEQPNPAWLRGILVRNGPGLFEMGSRNVSHAFDGFAKLVAWNFVDPNTTYFSTAFVKSNSLRKSKHLETVAPYILLEEPIPKFSMRQKLRAILRRIDNCPVNVQRFGSRENPTYVALTDGWMIYSFDPFSLDTLGRVDPIVPGFVSKLSLLTGMSSAHPLPEDGTDNFITFTTIDNVLDATIRLVRITSGGGRKLIRDITVPRLSYMHSFGLTKNYAVIFVFPLYIKTATLISDAAVRHSFLWNPDDGMTVFVVDLHSRVMFSVKTEPMFMAHFVNSFQEDDSLVIDYTTFENPNFLASFELARLRNSSSRNSIAWNPKIVRFTIDVASKSIKIRTFPKTPGLEYSNRFDLPTINPKFLYRKSCYVYGIAYMADGVAFSSTAIVKKNVCQEGQDRSWMLENHYPSEAMFVANPNGLKEDDGLLLSLVLDGERGLSYLAIFEASSLSLVNKAYLPIHTTFSIHGQYFPGA